MDKFKKSCYHAALITWGMICCVCFWIYDNFIAEMPEDQVIYM